VAFLVVACALAAIAAFIAFMSLGTSRAALAESQSQVAMLHKQLADRSSSNAHHAVELKRAKAEARENRDELKALKKKRFDDKKPVAPVVDERAIELDRAWRKAEEDKNALLSRVALLENELMGARLAAAKPAPRVVEEAPKPAVAVAAPVKTAPEIDPRFHAELRRKNEWYRRIYIVHQKELELERDKTAHVRKKFLDVCRDVVALEQIVGSGEINRMKTEQAAYQTNQETEAAPQS